MELIGGSNFELLAYTIFISPVSEIRITFQKNYDRTFLLFQGVPVLCYQLPLAWFGKEHRNVLHVYLNDLRDWHTPLRSRFYFDVAIV